MSDQRPLWKSLLPLSLIALFVISLLAAGVATTVGSSSDQAPASLAYCSGTNGSGAQLYYGATVQRDISISCAPPGATVIRVVVEVDLDHDCSSDLNIRLDNTVIHSTFLQEKDCAKRSGLQTLSFTSYAYNGDPVNDTWKLFVTDWCDGCDGYFNHWSIWVHYALPTSTPRATSTPTFTPSLSATATASSTSEFTPTPTNTGQPTSTSTPTGQPTPTPRATPELPPVTFPEGDWPWYAQNEISIDPEPPVPGQLTRLCAVVVNHDPSHPQPVALVFRVANFGIGLPFTDVGYTEVVVPPGSDAQGCVMWTPPSSGHWCVEALLIREGREPLRSQRNIDMDEVLQPGVPHSRIIPIKNPFDHPVTITLGLIPHLPDWGLELSQDVFRDVGPHEAREFTLTVTPPEGKPLPPDGQPIVDVEAYVGDELIGGFRKISRPPVALHRFPDPMYAEREITVHPYPPRAGEPTEICVELRNPSPIPQDVIVQFLWATFGIGVPFTPINGPRPVHLPPHSIVKECIHWIPPVGGPFCAEVEVHVEGYPPQRSQRNIDSDEPLRPGVPHTRVIPVGNPFAHPVTITLGLIPHLPDWGLELSQDVFRDVGPDEAREFTLTVTPPEGKPLPPDGQPIVDVEAFVEGELIGGFRKIFRPPVPIHRPRDPVYAESEIGVDPYPIVPGMPVKLSVEVFNPTDQDKVVNARFSVAPFGIGLPFSEDHIHPNPIPIFVPKHGAARGHVIWDPPGWSGKFCVQVTLELEGHDPVWSRRNVDVGEPLRPGEPHTLSFPLSTWPLTETVDVNLGLVVHQSGWEASLSENVLENVQPGQSITTSLTVTVPFGAELGTGEPIVDVEAFVGGELIGGFRKLDVPPISVHKPHEKRYAESELSIDPDPPQLGQESRVSTVLHNTGDITATVDLEFGWAKFGMGLTFTTTGMIPSTLAVTLGPQEMITTEVGWTPTLTGHQCVLVRLTDHDGLYEPQESQRNVDVEERPPCGQTKVFTFTVYNDSPFTTTVDIGMITFNVPSNWDVTTVPSKTLEIGPYSEGVVRVVVRIPCPGTSLARSALRQIYELQAQAGGVPTIDVEAYIDGDLVGGIEIRLSGMDEEEVFGLSLPVIMKLR